MSGDRATSDFARGGDLARGEGADRADDARPQGSADSYTLDGEASPAARRFAGAVSRGGGRLAGLTPPDAGPSDVGARGGTAPPTGGATGAAVRGRVRRLTAVGRDLARLTDRRAILGRIAAGARELLDADAACLILNDRAGAGDGTGDDAPRRVCVAARGASPRHLPPETGPVDERQYRRACDEVGGPALAVPVCDAGVIVGFVAVRKSGGAGAVEPAGDDVWLLDALADQAALALRAAADADREAAEARDAAAKVLGDGEARQRAMSRVAHDLRTPVLTFKLGCDLLDDLAPPAGAAAPAEDAAKRDDVLREMRLSADHLEMVAENLLQIGRLSTGLTDVEGGPVDLAETLEAAAAVVRLSAADRGQTLTVDAPAGLVAFADGRRVRQIVVNLLSNAAKFSPRGAPIDLTAAEDGEAVTVRVRDRGPGVPPDQADAVFQPYYRLDGAKAVAGSGLGLAIARDLARRMDGDLTVAPADGGGAEFTLTLPRG